MWLLRIWRKTDGRLTDAVFTHLSPIHPPGLALSIITLPSVFTLSLLHPLPNNSCPQPCACSPYTPFQSPPAFSSVQTSSKCSPLPLPLPASICLQVTHQSLTPNKHHLVASLRQPGQEPQLPEFVNVFHLERSPLVCVVPGSPGSSLTSLSQAQPISSPAHVLNSKNEPPS